MPKAKAKKAQIRKEIKEKLNRQSNIQRLRKSRLIKDKLFKLAAFKRAKLVMFYIAKDKEVQTRFMITAAQKIGKRIAVPTILVKKKRMIASVLKDVESETSRGPYGLRQPKRQYLRRVPEAKIDLLILPGLAFDKQGHRLGRGKGYYDKFLAGLSANTACIGLAFDFQVLRNLPFLSHDISVDNVISA
jgi:5-formyltetrahydrofolate cyclo-ligase